MRSDYDGWGGQVEISGWLPFDIETPIAGCRDGSVGKGRRRSTRANTPHTMLQPVGVNPVEEIEK